MSPLKTCENIITPKEGDMSDMRRRREVPEEEQLRNTLSIRWTDREHKLVCDTAWKNRLSCSQLIRDVVLESLGSLGSSNEERRAG